MRKWNALKRYPYRPEPVVARTDLQIRNLLDDPALRRAMGLGMLHPEVAVAATQVSLIQRPQRRFDRRDAARLRSPTRQSHDARDRGTRALQMRCRRLFRRRDASNP